MLPNPEDLISQAREARRKGRLNEAKQLFSQALQLCGEATDAVRAQALTGLGQIERDSKNNQAALGHYLEAAEVYRSLADPLRLAHTVRHVGDILRSEGRFEEARLRYDEALGSYRQRPERADLDLANTLRGFALLCQSIGETENAKSFWQEAKQLYETAHVEAARERAAASTLERHRRCLKQKKAAPDLSGRPERPRED